MVLKGLKRSLRKTMNGGSNALSAEEQKQKEEENLSVFLASIDPKLTIYTPRDKLEQIRKYQSMASKHLPKVVTEDVKKIYKAHLMWFNAMLVVLKKQLNMNNF